MHCVPAECTPVLYKSLLHVFSSSVQMHAADRLTMLGPRPIIASLSLGATRTFRIRHQALQSGKNAPTETLQGAFISFAMLLQYMSDRRCRATYITIHASPTGFIRLLFRSRLSSTDGDTTSTTRRHCGALTSLKCLAELYLRSEI